MLEFGRICVNISLDIIKVPCSSFDYLRICASCGKKIEKIHFIGNWSVKNYEICWTETRSNWNSLPLLMLMVSSFETLAESPAVESLLIVDWMDGDATSPIIGVVLNSKTCSGDSSFLIDIFRRRLLRDTSAKTKNVVFESNQINN